MLKRYQRATLDVVGMVNANRNVQSRLSQGVARIQRDHLLRVAELAMQQGLAAGRLSEASLRVTGGKLLLTARSCWFGAPTQAQMVVAAQEPNETLDTDDLPRHIEWHRAVYAATEAKATVLLQPSALLALATRAHESESELITPLRFEQMAHLWDALEDAGGIAYVRQPTFKVLGEAAAEAGVLVVAGVGALAYGKDGYDALARLQSAARWAEIVTKGD
jgi:hypothetical protein